MSKTGVSSMSVVEERAVTINISLDALVKNISDSACVECGSKLCAVRVLNAVHRPKDLLNSVEDDAIPRLFARMICREAAVVGRMPIFGRNDDIKARLQFIGDRNDFITVRNG